MKILVLSSHTLSLFWFRLDMMISFLNLGYEVIAAGSDNETLWKPKFDEQNIKYKQITVSRNGLNPLNDFKTFFSIKKLLKEERPDKIFVYQAKTIVYGALAAHHLNIKDIYPLVAGLGSVFRGTGVKNRFFRYVMCKLYRRAFIYSRTVIFQNEDDLNTFVENEIVDINKTKIINGSGVNIEKFKPAPMPTSPTFLYIGRLIKDKGIIEYLDACRNIKFYNKKIKCLLIGPFDTNLSALKKEELQPYIDDETIEYIGEQADVRPYIESCSVFVLPSYHEGTPKTVLEAMAVGRAIITSDAPGCRETVINEKNGFLVTVKDVKQLTDKMKYLIENPDICDKMGRESRKIVCEKYDVNIVNQSIHRIMGL